MKVKKSLVVALLVSAGFKTAPSFTEARIQKKITELPAMDWEGKTPSSPKLLDSLVSAVENNDTVTLLEDAGEKPAPAKEEKKAPKSKAKVKPVEEVVEEDEEEAEEEVEETPAGKKTKGKSKAKAADESEEEGVPKKVKPGKGKDAAKKAKAKDAAPKEKKPGVITAIVDMLTKATVKKPLSKDAMLEKLTEEFPDRAPEAMMSTINAQVPSRIRKERGLIISKNDKGYWIEASAE